MPTGRKPQLTLIVEQTPHRSNRELKARMEGEPKGCEANFRAPRELSAEAKKEWRRIIRLYKQLEVPILNDLDLSILSAYCESAAIYRRAQADYQSPPWNGKLVGKLPGSDALTENPYIKIMTREGQNMAKYAEQLCLSPVGRARMGLAKSKAGDSSDPMDEVLQRRMRRDVQ
jgi:P27 family predicted phage terminase small subunit